MTLEQAMRALANEKRLQILDWLKDPRKHFAAMQAVGDVVKDGVCGIVIARKLAVSQPTASEHLRILVQSGVLVSKRIKQWTYYKRDDRRIRELRREIANAL